jgi:hypothetical protein
VCRHDDSTEPRLSVNVDRSKVDPDVLHSMATGDSLSVIVLGANQLLDRIARLEQSNARTRRFRVRRSARRHPTPLDRRRRADDEARRNRIDDAR